MSMQRGLELVEYKRGQWFAFVAEEEYDYDFNSFQLFGPKPTEEEIDKLQSRWVSNTGGGWVTKKPKGSKMSDYMSQWQIKAIKKHLKLKRGNCSTFFSKSDVHKLKR